MNLNVIRSLIIRSSVEGADKTKADLKGIQSAHEGVARVTDSSAKGQLSLADAVAKAERRFNTSIRAQQEFEKVQRQMNLAVAQNPALQARANAVLALAATHFDQVSKGQRAFATATQAANDNLRGFAQSAGPAGSILSTFGTGGLVAAAGIGAAVIALHQMLTAATNLAERAGKLKDFAETTGFTVIELQALEKVGSQVGVSAESVGQALERFSVQMAEVRLRTGETYEKLVAINPVLARQVAEAESLSKAYELVSKAIKGASLEQGNQLARAFFGRSGVEQTRLMRVVGGDAGMKGVIDDLNKIDAITAQQADRWDTLGDTIAKNMKDAKQNIASIFTERVLESAERFSKAFLELSREMKQFEVSERLQKVMDFFSNPITQGAMAGALAGARGGLVGAGVGAVAGGGAAALFSQADAQQTAADIAKLRFELEQLELVKAGASRRVLESVDPAQVQQYASILERTNKRIAEIQSQMPTQLPRITVTAKAQTETYVSDAEAAAAADIRRRDAIVGLYNEMAQLVANLGGAATMWERYELGILKADAAQARNKLTAEQHGRVIAQQKQQLELSLGVADMAKVTEERLAQVREVAAKAGLTGEQQRLAVQIAMVEAKERERQAWRRANPEMAMAVDYAESLAKSLVSVAMGAGSISDAFKSLSGTLASDAIRSLFKGDLLAAGLQAAGAAVMAGLGAFFDDAKQKELEKAKLAFANMGAEVRNFNAAADGFELSQFVTAIQQITRTGLELVKAAMAAGDVAAAIQLIHAGVRQINNTVDQFIRPRGNTPADQIATENAQARQLIDELNALNNQYHLGLNRTTEILAAAAQHIAEIQANVTKTLQADINAATGKGFINDITDLVAKLNEFKNQQATTGVDMSLVDRWFTVQAQKVVDGAEIAGDAFNELVTLFPDLTGRVHEYTAAVEENAEALKRATNDTARNITDFLNNLVSGPGSTLSPTTVLANAQSVYDANLALAQGGNLDAQNKFVSLADNLEKAARAVFASGQEYQDIRNQIIAQGLTLPAVQETTDPVVIALRDAITEIQVRGLATVDAIATMQDTLASAMNSGNPAAVALALSNYFNTLDTNINGLLDFNEMKSALGSMASDSALRDMFTRLDADNSGNLDKAELIRAATRATQDNTAVAITKLTDTVAGLDRTVQWLQGVLERQDVQTQLLGVARAQLELLNQQLSGSFSTVTGLPTTAGPGGSFPGDGGGSVANNLLTALNKIVYNTRQIAENTGQDMTMHATLPSTFYHGTFERGGVLPAHGFGIMGEHHPQGPFIVQAGANPIPITPAMPSFRGGANDNSAVIAELSALRKEVAQLRKENNAMMEGQAKAGRQDAGAIVGAVQNSSEKTERAARMAALGKRVA